MKLTEFTINEERKSQILHQEYEDETGIGWNFGNNSDYNKWLEKKFFAATEYPTDIEGVVIKHTPAYEVYGGVAIQTAIGNFAVMPKDQQDAINRIGQKAIVRQNIEFYKTVEIIKWVQNEK